MREEMRRTAGAVLDWLVALAAEDIRPPEALARVHRLADEHPEARIDLVWEEQAYDRSVHYDALVRVPGGTVSLSWCPARAAIKQLLMDRWLEERRAAATIEWYWGNAGGVPPAIGPSAVA